VAELLVSRCDIEEGGRGGASRWGGSTAVVAESSGTSLAMRHLARVEPEPRGDLGRNEMGERRWTTDMTCGPGRSVWVDIPYLRFFSTKQV
jgi:hypothetical protein